MPHALSLYGYWLRRDLSQRFAESILGPAWLLLQPLAFVAVVTLVFKGFFGAAWPQGDGSTLDYALNVLVGLSVHTMAADVLNRCPGSIAAHPYLVTKVRYPLELLPMVVLGVALSQAVLTLAFVAVLALVLGILSPGQALAAWWAVPLYLLPLVTLLAGLGMVLAATGTYVRDLASLTPAIAGLLMFLSPVFYPADKVPASISWIVTINPVAHSIEGLRLLILGGRLPDTHDLLPHAAISLGLLWLGTLYFRRLRPGFSDVI
jgi:lipopolysaccharide transport system permease protein